MKPLISVILPVYGVEQYLNQCIESLVNQSYENIEIILVDDGSRDRCPQIIDEWAKRDSRVKALHKENGGQSSARNLGMDTAKGELITFVDSDDWVEPDYCEKLQKVIELFDADIAVGFFKKVDGKTVIKQNFFIPSEDDFYSCNGEQAVRYILEHSIAVWGKIYKSKVLKNLRFPEGRLAEEYAFQLNALLNCKTVGFCNMHLYNYRIRSVSDAHSIKPNYLLDNIYAIDEAYRICSEHFNFETDFCKSRLASLLYEFLSAEAFGRDAVAQRPDVIKNALTTVGGKENLLRLMETPCETVFYTFSQFYGYLSENEKKKLQGDYRKVFSLKLLKKYKLYFFLKYLPSYFSLEISRKISKFK